MANKTIGVIGSGTMGSGIIQLAAVAGCNVIMFDANKTALTSAYDKIKKTFDGLVQKNKITEVNANSAFALIKVADSLKDFNSCDLVIEAIIEDLEIKKELFKNLDEICQPSCILATNTSSI